MVVKYTQSIPSNNTKGWAPELHEAFRRHLVNCMNRAYTDLQPDTETIFEVSLVMKSGRGEKKFEVRVLEELPLYDHAQFCCATQITSLGKQVTVSDKHHSYGA